MAPSNAIPKIVIEECGNSGCRTFHTGFRISDCRIQNFHAPVHGCRAEDLEDVGEIGADLVGKILSIGGVTEIFIKTVEVDVRIGRAFGWEEIEPQVLALLVVAYNRTMEAKLTLANFRIDRDKRTSGGQPATSFPPHPPEANCEKIDQ